MILSHSIVYYIGHNAGSNIDKNATISDYSNTTKAKTNYDFKYKYTEKYCYSHPKPIVFSENQSNTTVYTPYDAAPHKRSLLSKDLASLINNKLNSQSKQDKISAIAFLSEYGSLDSKKLIKDIALSAQESESDVKAMAIVAADWSKDFNVLTDMLNNFGNNKTIKAAIINAVDLGNIDDSNKEQFNQLLLNQLNQESDSHSIINTLEYFKTKNDFWVEQSKAIVNSMTDISPEVTEYLKEP